MSRLIALAEARQQVWAFAAAAVLGLLSALVAPLAAGSVAVQYVAACVVLTIAVVGSIWFEARRSGDVMNVFAFTGLFFLLAFVAGSIWFWLNPTIGSQARVHEPFTHHGLMRAEWLFVLAWCGFVVGYRAGWLAVLHIPPLRLETSSRRTQDRAMLAIYAIGWVARVLGLSRGLYFHNLASTNGIGNASVSSSSNQIIAIVEQLPLVSVAYLGLRACEAEHVRWPYRTAIAIELVLATASGGRSTVIGAIIVILGIAYYGRGRFPLRATLIAILVALFFVFPVLALYRGNSVSTGYHASNFSQGVKDYTSGGVAATLLSGVSATFNRFSDIEAPATFEDRGRDAYQLPSGGTIPVDLANIAPHALYPSKQSVAQLENNVVFLLGLTPVRNSYFAPTLVGEMYLDFGTVGVALAFMVLGAVYRQLNDWLRLRQENIAVCALYLGSAYAIMQTQEAFLGDQLVGVLRGLLVDAVVIKLATFLFTRRSHAAVQTSHAQVA